MPNLRLLFAGLLLAVALPAHSQSPGSPPADPKPSAAVPMAADAQAVIRPLRYRSPFAAYQADKTEEPRSWRDVNDRVGAIGGWRVYAREAQPATSVPPVTQPPKTPGK